MYKIEYNNDSFYEPITAKWNTGLTVRDAHKVYQLFPLVVPHLRPHTEYRFRVIAINRVGPSPPSNVSQSVTTLEAGKAGLMIDPSRAMNVLKLWLCQGNHREPGCGA